MSGMYGSVVNRCLEYTKEPKIYVGQPVTEILWSDRHAYFVNKITKVDKDGNPIEVELIRATVQCKDYYAGDWEVLPFDKVTSNAYTKIARRTRADRSGHRYWTDDGRASGTKFRFDFASEYEDPSF